MRTVRLGRQFDAVFVQDTICYMASEADLGPALETAFLHTRPGGAALFAPDHVRETFRPSTDQGGGRPSRERPPRHPVAGVDVGSGSGG